MVLDQQDKPLVEYSNKPYEKESVTEVPRDANTKITSTQAKYDAFIEDLISDSGEIPLENRDDNDGVISITGAVSTEENSHDKISTAFEDITKAYNHDEDSTTVHEDEINWRSVENFHSDENKYAHEAANVDSVEDDSVEDYMDKKMDLEVRGRMETRQPERRLQFNERPMNVRRYEPPAENHRMLGNKNIIV